MSAAQTVWQALQWRRKRQMRLARALRKRRELVALSDNTASIRPGDILLFCTLRNEANRLPHFLRHYRALGVQHFLFVDNDSNDGSSDLLMDARDISVWHTRASYRDARFGMDWMQALLMRHGHGHWCLTVDVDELFIYAHHDSRPLSALTQWLQASGHPMMGALMLDLYPKGPLDATRFRAGDDPTAVLNWYDAANYTIERKLDTDALWIQGGPRSRTFLAETPRLGPTLTKIPLVNWHWRYVYLNSTHTMLPRGLNRIYATDGGEHPTGVLLHTKFLPEIATKSAEEKQRRQHFGAPEDFDAYYDAVIQAPNLWHSHSKALQGWKSLEVEGLLSAGGWG